MIDHGADVTAVDKVRIPSRIVSPRMLIWQAGNTPLHAAAGTRFAEEDHINTVKVILDAMRARQTQRTRLA